MAAPASGLSKAEYLRRRYLGGEESSETGKRRRKKQKQREPASEKQLRTGGMRIVDDDDSSWKIIPIEQEKEDEEGDDGDLPVVAEFIDERPDEVKWMEEFRTSNKWKLLGDQDKSQSSSISVVAKSSNSSEGTKQNKTKHFLDHSPPRRACRDSPDVSPKRLHSGTNKNNSRTSHGGSGKSSAPGRHSDSDAQLLAAEKQLLITEERKKRSNVGDSATKRQLHSTESSPRKRRRHDSESDSDVPSPKSVRVSSDSDLSPPRAPRSTYLDKLSDLSPPRRNQRKSSDSDLSPPRRSQETRKSVRRSTSPPDLSPPRRSKDVKVRGDSQKGPQMLSGGKSGLVSAELLRKEQQEHRRHEASSKHLEAESQHAETVFRDKSGRKRDLKQERLEQLKKAEEKSERDEQYAKWGKGLAQGRQQQQNVEDAVKEMEKPLARYIDDQDLDKMLREQEREGDPMADFFRKKKDKGKKETKEKPRYQGPAPPLNRFNIWPGYRWDGVDRSNGFEQKRFARISNKRAVQELAYKWSVEDM